MAAIAMIAATAPAALGHTRVTDRSPANGKSVSRSIGTVKVTFSQQIRSGSMRVYRGSRQVSRGRGGRNPGNVRQVQARLRSLGRGGTYTVRWSIRAADGHRQRGSWTFRVR